MSRWIRLDCAFYGDARTHKLRARIGERALWVVPRLWCFAAEQAPDGNLSAYPPDVLADELRYKGKGDVLVDALKEAGFLRADGVLVDWDGVYGLPAARHASLLKAREAKAAKHQGPAAESIPPSSALLPPETKRDVTKEDERVRNGVTEPVTDSVTEAKPLPLSPPDFASLTPEQQRRLAARFNFDTAAAADAYAEWRGAKINYGDTFASPADAFDAALAAVKRAAKGTPKAAAPVPEIPGWRPLLRDRAQSMGQDPESIPSRWQELTRDQQQVVAGQRSRAAGYAEMEEQQQASGFQHTAIASSDYRGVSD